jgi:hypothetical protein
MTTDIGSPSGSSQKAALVGRSRPASGKCHGGTLRQTEPSRTRSPCHPGPATTFHYRQSGELRCPCQRVEDERVAQACRASLGGRAFHVDEHRDRPVGTDLDLHPLVVATPFEL